MRRAEALLAVAMAISLERLRRCASSRSREGRAACAEAGRHARARPAAASRSRFRRPTSNCRRRSRSPPKRSRRRMPPASLRPAAAAARPQRPPARGGAPARTEPPRRRPHPSRHRRPPPSPTGRRSANVTLARGAEAPAGRSATRDGRRCASWSTHSARTDQPAAGHSWTGSIRSSSKPKRPSTAATCGRRANSPDARWCWPRSCKCEIRLAAAGRFRRPGRTQTRRAARLRRAERALPDRLHRRQRQRC